jgi:hypothetical protein
MLKVIFEFLYMGADFFPEWEKVQTGVLAGESRREADKIYEQQGLRAADQLTADLTRRYGDYYEVRVQDGGERSNQGLDNVPEFGKLEHLRDLYTSGGHFQREIIMQRKSAAMAVGLPARAAILQFKQAGPERGGIDLNTANMAMSVSRDADGGVKVKFDPALVVRLRQQGALRLAVPVIIDVHLMSMADINPLLGLNNNQP